MTREEAIELIKELHGYLVFPEYQKALETIIPDLLESDSCKENCKGYRETGKCFADGPCMVDPPASEEQAAILELCKTVRRYAAPAKDDDYCSRSELLRAVADAEKIAHGMK